MGEWVNGLDSGIHKEAIKVNQGNHTKPGERTPETEEEGGGFAIKVGVVVLAGVQSLNSEGIKVNQGGCLGPESVPQPRDET
jgi:hypothetical protein